MQSVNEAAHLRDRVRAWREQGLSIGLVPTMGNLHAGHLALLDLAHACCDRVVASIFVNPAQFGPDEDYDRYPRTLLHDQTQLEAHACDLLFAPSVEVMYPFGLDASVRVQVPCLTTVLEGAHRPGHFDGVTTVVAKLLHLAQPDVAVFGQKDYQQWRVIERMVADLSLPVQVVSAPIQRDQDGLAMSSRNQYLSAEQRKLAPRLHAVLQHMRASYSQGTDYVQVEHAAATALRDLGFEPDYAVIRRGADLTEPVSGEQTDLVALAAARLGQTRLIDNLPFD